MMKKALGKGLSALIPDHYVENTMTKVPQSGKLSAPQENKSSETGAFRMISTVDIQPNPDQPRKSYSPEGIEELAASIKEKGILQPVIVKKTGDKLYELICGERRLRASVLCGLTEIPAIVKDVATDELLEWALIENIQREDLNPLEEAQAYFRLAEERLLGQEEIAKRVGKNRATVANTIRLLRLPEEVKSLLAEGRLSAGHARALLGLPSPEHQRQFAKRITEENLSVRQVEAIVNRSNVQKRGAKKARHLSPEIADLELRMAQHLGTKVKIFPRKNMSQGRLEIHYYSLDDLDRILEKIGTPPQIS